MKFFWGVSIVGIKLVTGHCCQYRPLKPHKQVSILHCDGNIIKYCIQSRSNGLAPLALLNVKNNALAYMFLLIERMVVQSGQDFFLKKKVFIKDGQKQ